MTPHEFTAEFLPLPVFQPTCCAPGYCGQVNLHITKAYQPNPSHGSNFEELQPPREDVLVI